MKTRILIVMLSVVFAFANDLSAQKLSRKKVQITGLKNAKVLGTDAKGNVVDNSDVLLNLGFMEDYVPYENASKDVNLGPNQLITTFDTPQINNTSEINAVYTKITEIDKSDFENPFIVELNSRELRYERKGTLTTLSPNDNIPKSVADIKLPNRDGTLALLEDLEQLNVVPYMGANKDMNLNKQSLNFNIIEKKSNRQTQLNASMLEFSYSDGWYKTILNTSGLNVLNNNKEVLTLSKESLLFTDNYYSSSYGNSIMYKKDGFFKSLHPYNLKIKEVLTEPVHLYLPNKSGTLAIIGKVEMVGAVLPNLTTNDRKIVLDKTDNKLKFWNGTEWKIIKFE